MSSNNVEIFSKWKKLKLVKVPVPKDGVSFPLGESDNSVSSIFYPFYFGKSPVIWDLWSYIYNWATGDELGKARYHFQNPGQRGSCACCHGMSDFHPVTMVNWRDCIVWCNALTQWHNQHLGTSFAEVYRYNDESIKDSRDSNSIAFDKIELFNGEGFRLPSHSEWELAARWRGDDSSNTVAGVINNVKFLRPPFFTKGNSASGAEYGYKKRASCDEYAWYNENSPRSTQPVMTKRPNLLGIYDMSGNVCEWVYDSKDGMPEYRGGSWALGPEFLQIGGGFYNRPIVTLNHLGFRVARTIL
ncbi:MAG: SUMF1/EgtB/PvdO family nonheme iron enzyme [Spirochaetales bacterium]|nr:SUMF1/EgtB/PvdO family nonheme iron enzyme [Spirochaetales bacterium]